MALAALGRSALRLCMPAQRLPARLASQWTVDDEQSRSTKCDPHELGGKPLDPDECASILSEVRRRHGRQQLHPLTPACDCIQHHPRWALIADGRRISRDFTLPDYVTAMKLTQQVGHVVHNGIRARLVGPRAHLSDSVQWLTGLISKFNSLPGAPRRSWSQLSHGVLG